MDDVLLCSHVDGFVDGWDQFESVLFLSCFDAVRKFAHHRLQLRFVRLTADTAHLILAGALDGGLDERHASGRENSCPKRAKPRKGRAEHSERQGPVYA